jgi:SAM-dependent methyltransferase
MTGMDETSAVEREQAAAWNGPSGDAWVAAQSVLDGLFREIEEHLADAVAARPGGRVLDVGCGTGATTLAAARRLGARGRCTGVDISAPMVALARERAAREGLPVEFVVADAKSHPFEPASFDTVISRFGVMFFADPVGAFANLRRATSPDDGELRIVVWRSPRENPFMTTAGRAAAPLLPDSALPARRLDGLGQFGFADPDRVRAILGDSGWSAIDVQPLDVLCTMPERALMSYVTRLGPLGSALQGADDATRARVLETVRSAFDPFVEGD